MISLGPATKIYLMAGATDMRKSFEGLSDLVRHRLQADPLSGHLFLFSNRRRNRLKILYFDATGLWVCAKRLERGAFSWPQAQADSLKVRLSAEEFHLLIGGVELERTRRKNWWRQAA